MDRDEVTCGGAPVCDKAEASVCGAPPLPLGSDSGSGVAGVDAVAPEEEEEQVDDDTATSSNCAGLMKRSLRTRSISCAADSAGHVALMATTSACHDAFVGRTRPGPSVTLRRSRSVPAHAFK